MKKRKNWKDKLLRKGVFSVNQKVWVKEDKKIYSRKGVRHDTKDS